MQRRLLIAIIIVLVIIMAAVLLILYMRNRDDDLPPTTKPPVDDEIDPTLPLTDMEKCTLLLDTSLGKGNYTITDPTTCSYRKIGEKCAPIKEITVPSGAALTTALDQAKLRGTWGPPEDNTGYAFLWRCMPGAIYYGKTPDATTCGNKCMIDGTCTSWSWNKSNSGGEQGECWGIDASRGAAQNSGANDPRTLGVISSYFSPGVVQECTTPECLKAACLKKIEDALFPGETYIMLDEAKCMYAKRPSPTCDMTVKVPRLRDVVPMPAVASRNYLAAVKCVPYDAAAKTGAFYYGKKDTADKCRIECEVDGDCSAWTWNENNGVQGVETIGECWGAPSSTIPAQLLNNEWTGYVSGKL